MAEAGAVTGRSRRVEALRREGLRPRSRFAFELASGSGREGEAAAALRFPLACRVVHGSGGAWLVNLHTRCYTTHSSDIIYLNLLPISSTDPEPKKSSMVANAGGDNSCVKRSESRSLGLEHDT